ncbi:MAG: DNA gyrase subunit A [Gammaproteobacteria bacterium]|nr:DNA gyrase subunit A [Gammaproteobacteria bacterium]NNF61917.1 DNA gyrase subunit A [Gammaproteobacteria bacterium]NNM19779.1 DNA gyrase subunit A [Gammaproteobacteria bacterium]
MTDAARELLQVNLEDEMKQSYLDYAMSVIVGRALPDVRDGLKPVHRRILFSMHENNNAWNRPYVKCARVVGDVLGKYHPHGDGATYDALVRMAQDFSMRYTLIDGQGNFGSIDGDPPAAYRYTECRMTRLASELLADIDKETVDFVPNYDAREQEPTVLPTRIPSLLVNGSSGIAVGMATNVPPHNLREVIDATLALLENPDIGLPELMQHLPGPDFPTAGIINGARGIVEAYKTGRGRIYVRARTEIEERKNNRQAIIVNELPYQVNKARLLEKIAELVREKRLDGISDLRDESDKDGMRMVIELKRGEVADVVLNNLYKQTMMQSVFGINIVALSHGQPRLLNLKEVLDAFLQHRREVVTRRTIYDLRKARDRAHVLEGLAVALANIDPVIALIKKSKTPADARVALVAASWQPGVVTDMLKRAGQELTRPENSVGDWGLQGDQYKLSETQAQAILELRLHRLTGLEQNKLVEEYRNIIATIENLTDILDSPDRLTSVISEELAEARESYSDERRTEIVETQSDLTIEDLITEEDVVVTLSHAGYAKAQPLGTYQAQRRGGRGKAATQVKDEDFVDKLFVANTHDTLLCFSTRGKLYWLKVYQVPQASRGARGRPIVNLLPLEADERITAVLPIRDYEPDRFITMATSKGTVKKTELQAFSRPRTNGIIAVALREDDALVDVEITEGNQQIMLFASNGKAIRFDAGDVRPMGRNAAGVRGIRLDGDDRVISLIVVEPDADEGEILIATAKGYGKRTLVTDFPSHRRGGQGVIAIQTTERNGVLVGAVHVSDDDEVMLISAGGTLVRTEVAGISRMGRNTQGVRLIRVQGDDALVGMERIDGLNGDSIEPATNDSTQE